MLILIIVRFSEGIGFKIIDFSLFSICTFSFRALDRNWPEIRRWLQWSGQKLCKLAQIDRNWKKSTKLGIAQK